AGDLTATIDWGDGTSSAGTVSGGSGSFAVDGSHTYANGGEHTLTLRGAGDPPGNAHATPTRPPPGHFSRPKGPPPPTQGAALPNNTPVATFTDSDSGDAASSFAAMIEWGDGAHSSGTVTGVSATPGGTTRFTVSGSHTYTDEGSDTATVILTRTADQASS